MSLPDAASRRTGHQHYVGDDRRAGPPADLAGGTGALGIVSALLAVLWLVTMAGFFVGARLPVGVDDAGLASLLAAAAAALGGVVTVVAFVRWRLIGETRILWLGTAAFFLGPVAAGAGGLIPEMVAGATPWIVGAVLVPTAEIVGIVALVAAATVPEVDTRMRPTISLALGTTAALGAATALWVLPGLSAALTGATGGAGVGIAWCGVAALHARTARQTHRRHYVAIVVAASGLAFAATTRSVTAELIGPFESMPYVFVVASLGVLFAQGIRDLETAFCVQREQLLDRQVVVETEQARRRAEQTGEGRRRHDARNALMAIQGAAYVLDRHRDRIDDTRRTQLASAMAGEVDHLRELIETSHDPAPFDISAVVNDVVDDERAPGSIVHEVDGRLAVVGRDLETAEVVRRLIRNAQRRAPGAPVTVRSREDGDWVVVHVEDRGAGVGRSERNTIFESPSGESTEGGLGLFVCRRLMVDQGGDLWVENRDGGGASFALCLPRAPAPLADDADPPAADTTKQEVSAR